MLLGDMSGGNAVDVGTATETTPVTTEGAEGTEQQPSAETTQETDEARKRTGYQRKLDKKDAELAAAAARIAELERGPTKAADAEVEPKLEDFEEWGDFIKAQAKFEAKQALREDAKSKSEKERETALRNERKALEDAYKAKVNDFRTNTPDYDKVCDEYDGPWNGYIEQALLESDLAPQIIYYLGKNLDEADKLEGMNLTQVNRFIGRIEAKLEGQQPTSAKTTQAQPPITPIRKGATVTSKDPGDMSLSEFEAWERSRKK